MPEPMGLGSPSDDEPRAISWPAATAAVMISLFVMGGVVLMCLGCLGVFGGGFIR